MTDDELQIWQMPNGDYVAVTRQIGSMLVARATRDEAVRKLDAKRSKA